MVGVHDFDLYLRDRLRQFMSKNTEILKGNWRTERLKTDKMYGIQSEESKFDSCKYSLIINHLEFFFFLFVGMGRIM